MCEICGGKGDQWPVECHERWAYDERTHAQKLIGLIALCPACHQVKHIGLAAIRGRLDEALDHYAKINKLTVTQASRDLKVAADLWAERSQIVWEVDISWATSYLKSLPKPLETNP